MLTRREAAIISAYTGYLIGPFSDMHEYIEEKFERPVWTHELPPLADKLRELSKEDFLAIKVDGVTVNERGIARAEGPLPK
ncbi:hypothetical protein SEA_FRANCOB_210 [Streptomyces phage Francob]